MPTANPKPLAKFACCGELAIFGHASTCSNRPASVVIPARKPRAPAGIVADGCIYCGTRVGPRGLSIDGDPAHRTCHNRAVDA